MGNGMANLCPGLYLGSIKDRSDKHQLSKNNITHILAIHDHPKPSKEPSGLKLLRIHAKDNSQQDIKQFFKEAIFFIHEARLNDGNVLVHCLAGVSRSASLCIAYIMTITGMPWHESMNALRGAREQVNPNYGFQRQLQNFEHTSLKIIRSELYREFGDYNGTEEERLCREHLKIYKESQSKIESARLANSVNTHSYKDYPLPYNAYNLDTEAPKKSTQERNETVRNNTSNEQEDPAELEKEKKEFVDKIFS